MIELFDLLIMVLAVEEGECRTEGRPLGPAGLQDERLHFGLVLFDTLEVVVQKEYFPGFNFLDRVQPAEVDHGFSDDDYESDAVRSGDELCLEFDHLAVYQHLRLLQQQLQCTGLVHLVNRSRFDLTPVLC